MCINPQLYKSLREHGLQKPKERSENRGPIERRSLLSSGFYLWENETFIVPQVFESPRRRTRGGRLTNSRRVDSLPSDQARARGRCGTAAGGLGGKFTMAVFKSVGGGGQGRRARAKERRKKRKEKLKDSKEMEREKKGMLSDKLKWQKERKKGKERAREDDGVKEEEKLTKTKNKRPCCCRWHNSPR